MKLDRQFKKADEGLEVIQEASESAISGRE
jgi:hypothetical protein